ncbi:hypothetical protein PLICRDRAFT_180909 [Plicaturopsis crispa FD-325 SS-3]|nr:hypothetical protein PLICRDRAFT_180909 [Plicaturopsis crispa FD-325 SS-3]
MGLQHEVNPDRCAECVGRRAAEARVRGVMVIPNDAVLEVLEKYGKNGDDVPHEEVIELLKSKLVARIVSVGSATLADAVPDRSSETYTKPLDKAKHPRLRLHSAGACVPKGDLDDVTVPHDVDYFDWQDHGVVFEDMWHHVPA